LIVSLATASDLPEIAALVNSAYRGDSARQGWTHEADLVGGQRTDPDSLARDLAGQNPAVILTLREREGGPILASVFLERVAGPDGASHCYLGMLSVSPPGQNRGLGRILLAAAEDQGREWGAARMVMTVIDVRDTLIAYYERRGYRRTSETEPFPYDDPLFGIPRCACLTFVVMEKPL
jgi:GNAT superfamily N-acetyltransferase